MTAFTVGPELAVVDIVGLVAVRAVAAELRLRIERPPVAGFAGCVAVGARQGEVGLPVVIEQGFRPSDRVVAESAFFAKIAVMRVVIAMTVSAGLWRITEHVRVMAGIAFSVVVFAEQRKARQAMVEEHLVLPG